jgi:uncharacterized protein
MKRISKTWLYIIFTFGLSYGLAGLFIASGGEFASAGGMVMAIVYMFMPALSVLIIEKVIYREEIRQRLLISFKINKWFAVAWLVPLALALFTFVISLLFPQVSYSPGMEGMFARYERMLSPEQVEEMKQAIDLMPIPPVLMILLQGMIAGITINAVAGFGEELGWRGFLVRQFEGLSFWKSSLIIGFIWGIWHAPVILMGHNYPGHPVAGVFMMTIWCILLSPLFLYITLKSRSVIAASVLHGTINATGALSILLITGGNDLLTGLTGLAGFFAVVLVLVMFLIYDRYISGEKMMQGKVGDYLPPVPLHENKNSYGKREYQGPDEEKHRRVI